MKIEDGEAALFAVKCFVAAMLAYYVALRIGLTRPYWAVTTSFIIAQPLAGAVLSKAVFRFIGTMLGGAAAVLLVPTFVNEPMVLSAALALWLGICLYLALLDRTPRAYIFLLAGYTASIIGFPSVDSPATIFDSAVLRVQEISIGIAASSLVHGVIFPRTVTDRLLARIDAILSDAERWTHDSLGGAREATLDRERRRLALDLAELHQLSSHLPFDTARLLPRVRTVRALQDQLSLILPLTTAVEDRLAELDGNEALAPPIWDLIKSVQNWIESGVQPGDRAETAALLIKRALVLEPTKFDSRHAWREMLLLNLLSRLADLITAHRNCRDLRDQIRSPSARSLSPQVDMLLSQASGRALHRDRRLAIRAACGTFATILLGCMFWIFTAWPDGAGAVLISGVCCALFGSMDQPGRKIFTFLQGTLLGTAMAALYAYAVMPRVTDFFTLGAVFAPPMLLLASVLARPKWTILGIGSLLGFLNLVGLNATYSNDFASFANGALAQIVGTVFAVVTVGLFQTIGVESSVGRLLRAGWWDVSLRARGKAPDTGRWLSRMLDRIGLLGPRLTEQTPDPGKPLLDALVDLRTGIVVGELDMVGQASTAEEQGLIRTVLSGIAAHFANLDPRRPMPPTPGLLSSIDDAMAMFADDPSVERRRGGLLALTSLRRNLFPVAPAYPVEAL